MQLEDRGENLWATVTADMQRYDLKNLRPWSLPFLAKLFRQAYQHPGLLAVLIYRYGQWVEFRCRIPLLKQICDASYYSLFLWARSHLQIEVPRTTAIDAGFRIDHFGPLLINAQVIAGKRLTVSQGVVIGQTKTGIPRLGDNVRIAVGAKVIGGITIGDNVVVGAQSVVTKDVPDNAIVAGVPAKTLRFKTPRSNGSASVMDTEDEDELYEEDRVCDPTHQDR
jgi:serine O-acetyltransferase